MRVKFVGKEGVGQMHQTKRAEYWGAYYE